MSTEDDYNQNVSIASLTDPPNAEVLAKNIANAIVAQALLRFASASARTASLTGVAAPVEGMVAYLADVDRYDYYNGSTWLPMRGQASSSLVTAGSSSTTTEVATGMQVSIVARAGIQYELVATCLGRSTVAHDRLDLRIRRGTTTGATQVGGGTISPDLATTGYTLTARGLDIPGAGNITWTVFIARGAGTGSVEITASTALPAVFTVREV